MPTQVSGNSSELSYINKSTDTVSSYCVRNNCSQCSGKRQRKYGLERLCGCPGHRKKKDIG
jgi:hypothetical protein